MAAPEVQINVGGRWLSLECMPGDVTLSTVWPGGSDELSWSLAVQDSVRFTGGEPVVAYFGGGVPVFAGSLLEPDPSQDQLVAQGAWREAEGYAALDGSSNATTVPDTAIDQAIVRGLRWTRPNSIRSTTIPTDVSQGPIMLDQLLDLMVPNINAFWGVNVYRQVFTAAVPTTPLYQTLPQKGGLGYALDNYASTLIGRYLDSGTSTYKTVTATNTPAQTAHGHKEQIVDLTPRAAISSTTATNIVTNLLTLGKAIPSWTVPLDLAYGEIVNVGGTPVSLESVAAGPLLRVHGGFELAERLNGAKYIDVQLGRTSLTGGVLTVTPAQLAVRSLTDAITAALSTKRGY